ncbi:zinc finger, CCHC-type containing protein [Tanacetum coccineum]
MLGSIDYLACVFGVVGANNDINVLDNSPLFDDLLDDKAPVASFVVNRIGFEKGYYLADIIYPEWATFVKSFTVSNDAKHGYFKKRQESARKDVESAFSVLQGRWGKIAQPAQDTNQHHKTADCFGINSQSDYHQMDVKTTFLNGELEEDVYMNQLQGFIIPGNENKVCKLIKFLYGLNEAPKQWQQKFDEVVLSNGYLLNQADKYVYNKFDETSKGVIIFLYVNDMLIFSTDQVQVDLIKKFLSSRFSIKDMGEADVILGIRIKHESNGIDISQSHYIEKVLKKFNYFDCTPVSTPIDTTEKLMPNNGQAVSQLEYSSGWVFLLGGGAISWASKKQTCITALTMESEFMALAAADREAECLRNLILECIIDLYMSNYLRKPTLEDVENIYTQHEDTHGFSRMLGSINFGANNDINVLDNSPLFNDLLDDKAPVAPFVVNRIGFEKGYYLADRIYPEWATFVKSFTVSNDAKHSYFKKRQESARKDVEHAFGVLQGRWGIIAQPAQDTNQHHKTADCFGINSQSDYHQMDVKTTFLNGELEEDVYMNLSQGFIIPGNEKKVDLIKKFLSLRFSIKDMGEADVILGIRIKHEMSTHMDTSEKLMPNNGHVVSQLEYSRYTRNPGTQHWQAIQRNDILMEVGSAILKTIRLPVAGYSCLVEVQSLRLLRNKLA